MDLRRGDVIIFALQGDHGKPRPAVVIQSDLALQESVMIAILPLTGDIPVENIHRIAISPSVDNGLREASQTMIERLTTTPRSKIGKRIGRMDSAVMAEIDHSLRLWLGLI